MSAVIEAKRQQETGKRRGPISRQRPITNARCVCVPRGTLEDSPQVSFLVLNCGEDVGMGRKYNFGLSDRDDFACCREAEC